MPYSTLLFYILQNGHSDTAHISQSVIYYPQNHRSPRYVYSPDILLSPAISIFHGEGFPVGTEIRTYTDDASLQVIDSPYNHGKIKHWK